MSDKHHSITDVVEAVFCERKVQLRQAHGEMRLPHIDKMARQGRWAHKRFEIEGRTRVVADNRCFIASAVFGSTAPETDFLRGWRDQYLTRSITGRRLIAVYYVLSPHFVLYMDRHESLRIPVRKMLSCLVRLIGYRP